MRKTMKIAICEDDTTQLDYIRTLVAQWAEKRKIPCETDGYVSAEQLIYSFDEDFPYQIYILDIQMGEMNGMELAGKIRKKDSQAAILFLTGLKEYALEGYKVGAVRYLLKPLNEEELFEILDEVMQKKEEPGADCFLLERSDGIRKIPYREIWYVESQGHYVEMAYGAEKIRWKASLGGIQTMLEEHDFVMMRRGMLANLSRIARVSKAECVLDNGEHLPVSRSQYKAVNEAFIQYYKNRKG